MFSSSSFAAWSSLLMMEVHFPFLSVRSHLPQRGDDILFVMLIRYSSYRLATLILWLLTAALSSSMEISSSSSTLNPVQEDQQPGSPLVFQHTISSPLKLHGNNNDTVEADEDVRRAVEQAVSSNLTAGKKTKKYFFLFKLSWLKGDFHYWWWWKS